MKLYVFLAALVALVVITECKHTFLGTNIMKEQVYRRNFKYSAYLFQKRVEELRFALPDNMNRPTIQGILAYDKIKSKASVNVTKGGLGFNYLTLRLKSEKGRELNYDIYIYA